MNGAKCADTPPAAPGAPEYRYVGKFVTTLTLAQVHTLDCGSFTLPKLPPARGRAGCRSFDYTLPGGSLVTFTWPHSADLASTKTLVDPWSTAMTSNVGNPASAGAATDDDGSTPWTSGTAQAPGQWLQVDLGHAQRIRQVVLDAGPSTYGWPNQVTPSADYPRGVRVEVSTDGRTWTDAREVTGTGQLTVLTTTRNPARYVRATLTRCR